MGIESTSGQGDGAQRMEPGASYPIEHAPPERLESIDAGHEGVARAESGYKDRPLREFRQTRPGEYIEPYSRTSEVEPFRSPETIAQDINPRYEQGGAYEINCADCSRSVERTWRGHSEEAAGRVPEHVSHGVVEGGEQDGITESWAGERFAPVPNAEALRASLEAGGHGSSAIVHTRYEFDGDDFGHAYNVVNHHSEIRVVDGQSGETFPWSSETIYDLGERQSHDAMAWDGRGQRIW